MNKVNLQKRMKLFGTLLILIFCIQIQAQNDQVTIEPMGKEEFSVRSLNGIPYTLVVEESNTDGQYHLGSTGYLTFKLDDMIQKRSTVRIVLEEEIHASLEEKLVKQYRSDVDWIKSLLDIKEDSEFKVFPSRPIFSDADLEKLKGQVFEYADTDNKEKRFYEWIEKINYSVGAVRYFRELYAASNGKNNEQRRNFLPINIYEALNR
ncbi:hypothetical protein D1816_00815 [Aquimarina sp. AD10]|uniref:DUF4369 domain-containing protein n=1 Tax=Aquimarina aggregata TaxID=1642818 RepID=A0A162CPF0_9FLAO|nr:MULTISPECIES: hypothetical protein [Aquimarina]AXT58951.1 hypothetical protein D1816_00815 [Aquimarina sp. AD10]KZS40194.1 hypothetical protein AWE51_24880 [Aquimarina aggregata]RKM99573.1 hypothetical protein D7033_10395 [Aquimarina sp. AD10]